MPIPTPNKGEKEQDFIDRCMGNETMKTDYPERDQRYAICLRSWEKEHGTSDMKNFSHNNTVSDSEPSWGGVDKTSLPRIAFADQGEADKKSTWSYPHHWVSGGSKDDSGVYTTGTLYLHKGGLNAAWAAANGARSGQEASSAVKSHLEAHRKALGLDDNQNIHRGFSIKAQANEAEIYLYEEIGSGWFGGVGAKEFKDELLKIGKVNNISVRLNSPGGDVFDGLAIYNLLKQNPARVTVYIDGLAASIASVIAMAGDEIRMGESAMLMVHDPWTMAMGDAQEMRDVADRLEKVGNQLLNIYSKRTGLKRTDVADLMAAETWMTGEEAMLNGFIDSIVENLQLAAHFDMAKFNYRHNPFVNKDRELEPQEGLEPQESQDPVPDIVAEPLKKRFETLKLKYGGMKR
jgi:ATP-dependent Clp protease protease subunit